MIPEDQKNMTTQWCSTGRLFINWRDVQRKGVVNNVDMASLRAPWHIDPYKNQLTEHHKNHVEHQDAVDI